jgi:hypothetical protein
MHTRRLAFLAGAAGVLALNLASPAAALAQAARVGDTQLVMPYTLGRWPDVEYDTTNQVYLAVRGYAGNVLGAFLRPESTPFTDPFIITQASNVTTARVCYAGDNNMFLVTWIQEPSFVKGRLLRFTPGGVPSFLTDIFEISTAGPKFTEAAPACAYSPEEDRFLVTWAGFTPGMDVRGQLVSLAGTLIGAEIPVADSAAWESLPSVAYNPTQREFYVVYTAEMPHQVATGTRVSATTGNVVAVAGVFGNPLAMNHYPEVVYNSVDNEYFIATWYFSSNGPDVWGHRVSATGAPVGSIVPIEANPFFEGGDGIGLGYNRATNSYFVASQGPSGEAIGAEVSAAGVASPVFRVTVLNDNHNEIYQPQIAGNPDLAQFLVVTNVDFTRMVGQVIGSTPVSSCPYAISDNGVSLGAAGASGQFTLTTTADCAWTASSSASWLEVLSATSGTGNATIQWRVGRNSSTSARGAVLTIGNRTFAVNQNGARIVVIDFNGDGSSDLLWQHQTSGNLANWRMAAENMTRGVPLQPGSVADRGWNIVSTMDMNRDGHQDLLWRHDTGYVAIWYMREEALLSAELVTPNPISDLNWKIVTAGDLNGDGSADIIWQHTDGRVGVWYFNGPRYLLAENFINLGDPNWRVVGSGDMNGDGRMDLIWQHNLTRFLGVWFMRGTVLLDGVLVSEPPPDASWRVAATVDLDRDGCPDVVWQNGTTGELAVWLMNGASFSQSRMLNPWRVVDTNWKIVGPR